ncbi:response regulator [Terrarubrum flagellatum]|uniref:response regulator n=1 Tax=Terrirubrum flagellatum TaxID=2895980 RepID=UPI003144FC94
MAKGSLKLHDLYIVVADANAFQSTLVHGMLRGFGANNVLEVRNSIAVLQALSQRRVDILLCDAKLPVDGGFALTRTIRCDKESQNRIMPIFIMASDTREVTVNAARDAGANMVIAKPMSPSALYDRLSWVALRPRQYVDTETYFGPDRRFKIEGYPNGVGRRRTDSNVEVAEEAGPSLEQDDIDSLFKAAREGRD